MDKTLIQSINLKEIAESDVINYISIGIELRRFPMVIRIKFSLPILIPEMGHHPLSYPLKIVTT